MIVMLYYLWLNLLRRYFPPHFRIKFASLWSLRIRLRVVRVV